MTGHDDCDRAFTDWIQADALASPPAGGLERVLGTTRGRRPRPAWLAGPGSHWIGEEMSGRAQGFGLRPTWGLRWSTPLILLAAVVALVGMIYVGSSLLKDGRPGALAFAYNGDIYVADWDGRNAVLIGDGDPFGGHASETCGSFAANGQMWSPDGRLLAYGAERDLCGWTTRIVDPSGTVVATLNGGQHAWSRDSARIATFDVDTQELWIYGSDGVLETQFGNTPNSRGQSAFEYFEIDWSPDGASVLFTQGGQTWQVPVDGGAPLRLSDGDPEPGAAPRFSPDGHLMAFVDGGSLWIASPNGSDRRKLVSGVDETGIWSPRGDRIAFVGTRDQPDGWQRDDIGVVDPANGQVTWLGTQQPLDSDLRVHDFAADGDQILYSTKRSIPSLWSWRISTGEAKPLVANGERGDWRPPTDP